MWKLSKIKIKNIVSFHEAELSIKQGVATLIFGRNEDNAAQPCNGSGKSSLIEAISFALTGEQLRKVKSVEEIINDDAVGASVSLCLVNDYDGVRMTINRHISRNAPQQIQIIRQFGPLDTDIEEIIQPTVFDYNRYILSEIGLTKDDIYNNFILCDNKYESFFDCSDKSKKDIINRFSNGVLVDESIARVQTDMMPVAEKLIAANNEIIGIKGSISAIERELDQVDEKVNNARQDRQRHIERLEEQIQECLNNIDESDNKRLKGGKRLRTLKRLQSDIADIEKAEMSMLDSYIQIKAICDEYELGAISDYEQLSASYKERLNNQLQFINTLATQISDAETQLAEHKKEYAQLSEEYHLHSDEDSKLRSEEADIKAAIDKEIELIDNKLDKIEASIKENKKRQSELAVLISRNTALLDGAVVCPKCNHTFFVGETSTVDEIRSELVVLQNEAAQKKSQITELNDQFDKIDCKAVSKSDEIHAIDEKAKVRRGALEKEYQILQSLSRLIGVSEGKIASLQRQQISTQNEIDRMSGKIDVLKNRLFGEINGMLEGRIMNGEQFLEQQASAITFIKAQLSQYQKSKQELIEAPEVDFAASLKTSLENYQTELAEAEVRVVKIQAEYDVLKGQEAHFIIFKSYIARKKINALSLIVNDFLEKIGSDIRLKLEGFTVTKTGKLRDKISVMVMRDGIDCGSYHKFSGGEKARLNLACILALHTLINSNCEDGKGLDFIIIDELLDKSDEVGMAFYCEALNKLKQTALLITQGNVSEGYLHKLLIVKKHGISTISD